MDHGTSARIAARAIATHSKVAGLDDEGHVAGVGLWHLLHSLDEVAREDGFALDDVLTEARSARKRPYMVAVQRKVRDVSVAYGDDPVEFEVEASSLADACGKVLTRPSRRPDVRIRRTREAYGQGYVQSDPSVYMAVARIVEGDQASVTKALSGAAASAAASPPHTVDAVPAASFDPDIGTAGAARLVLRLIAGGDIPSAEAVRTLADALLDYAESTGQDIDAMMAGIRDDRDVAPSGP